MSFVPHGSKIGSTQKGALPNDNAPTQVFFSQRQTRCVELRVFPNLVFLLGHQTLIWLQFEVVPLMSGHRVVK